MLLSLCLRSLFGLKSRNARKAQRSEFGRLGRRLTRNVESLEQRQLLTTFADASWVGTLPGADPDDAGPATLFGVDSFATIQAAVNAEPAGGTVIVGAGLYDEMVTITKDMTLAGATGIAADVVIAPTGGPLFAIHIAGVTVDANLQDLSVTADVHGINAINVGDLALVNVTAIGNGLDGLHVNGAQNVLAFDSTFSSNGGSGIDVINVPTLGVVSVTNMTASGNAGVALKAVISGSVFIDGGTVDGFDISGVSSIILLGNNVTSTENVRLEADENIVMVVDLDATSADVLIKANLGENNDNFFMATGTTLKTTSELSTAISINVNTLLGGAGDAFLSLVQAGTTSGRVSIFVGDGIIKDNNDTDTNIIAKEALLLASGSVGTSIKEIDTIISNLEGAGANDFYVTNTGTLIIGDVSPFVVGVSSLFGVVVVIANSPLIVNANVTALLDVALIANESAGSGDDLTVNPGVTVSSTFGSVLLGAGDNLLIPVGATVNANMGVVVLNGDINNNDPQGSTITLNGTINSAVGAFAGAGSDDDQFIVTAMGLGGLQLDGLGGDDTYTITYPTGSSFGSTITVDEVGAGTDAVIVNATNLDDVLFVTTEDPPTTATTEEVSRTVLGNERIILNGNLETLRLNALDGLDVVHAQPSMLLELTLDGGEPCYGDPGVPPGDVLDFNAFGNEVALDFAGVTISTSGGVPDPFQPVTFFNFETFALDPIGTGPIQRFDFDHTNTASAVGDSPTQPGYTSVLPTTLYSGGLGYGWQFAVNSFERDDGFYDNSFSDLVRDGHTFGALATFTVDVPSAGYYVVSVVVGSPYTDIFEGSIMNGDTGTTVVSGMTTLAGASANYDFVVYTTDGTLDLTFVHSVANPKIFAVNGLTVRPASILTIGTCSDPLAADGVTVDSFPLIGAPPNTLLTIATTLGTIKNPDVDDELAGIQVLSGPLGEVDILLQRPFAPSTAVLTFLAVNGSANGSSAISYFLPNARNFDFNHINTSSATGQSPTQELVASAANPMGYLGIVPTTLYTAPASFGWLEAPRSFDLGIVTDSDGDLVVDPHPLATLRRDGQYDAAPRTFRVQLPNGTYQGTATFGYDRDIDGMQISVNADVVASNLVVDAGDRDQVSFNFTVTNGIADFEFDILFAKTPNWALNGLQIEPTGGISPITFGPNIGLVPADGLTLVTVQATSALAEGTVLTVASSLGTIETPDINLDHDGFQILVGAGGAIAFDVLAPTVNGTPKLTATTLDGLTNGAIQSATFLDFGIAESRRFDFDHTQSNGSFGPSPTAATFIGVLRTDTAPSDDGFGWTLSPNSYDVGVPNEYDQGGSNLYGKLFTDLYRDYASGHTTTLGRTFRVQVTSADYDVRVYVGAQNMDQSVMVTVEGVAGSQSLATVAKQFGSLEFNNANDANNDGFLDVTFISAGGISPFWAVSGLDIAEVGAGLPLNAPLVGTDQGIGFNPDPLTDEELAPVIVLARQSWLDQGISGMEAALLFEVQFQIRDLGENSLLGFVDGLNRIVLDDDGAGHGWSTQLDQQNGDRYDLLTVIAHEMGHLLGREDLNPFTNPDDLMSAILGLGERHESLDGVGGFFAGGGIPD